MDDTPMVGIEDDAVPIVDDALADELIARAEDEGIGLLGPGGLLRQMTKAVLERALAEELTEHLGYLPHERAGTGNTRNGTTPKSLITEAGSVDFEVPRDRAGTFAPRIVPRASGVSMGSTSS
jgi:putative transposase